MRVSLECVSAGDLEVRLEPEVSVPVGLRRLDAVDGGPLVAGAVDVTDVLGRLTSNPKSL